MSSGPHYKSLFGVLLLAAPCFTGVRALLKVGIDKEHPSSSASGGQQILPVSKSLEVNVINLENGWWIGRVFKKGLKSKGLVTKTGWPTSNCNTAMHFVFY